jgi:hypothetical protein
MTVYSWSNPLQNQQAKRSTPELSSEGSSTDSPVQTAQNLPKRKKLSAEEKAEKRKQQTREASKLYRQRKKVLETELSDKISQLEEEKKKMMEQFQASQREVQKLKEENNNLKQKTIQRGGEVIDMICVFLTPL